MRMIGVLEQGIDWYADMAADTHVHTFFAMLFFPISWNAQLGYTVLSLLYFSVVLGTHLLLTRLLRRAGISLPWIVVIYLFSILVPKYFLYGYLFIIDQGITPRMISWILIIVAYLKASEGRWNPTFSFLTCASLFHPSDGLVASIAFIAGYLFCFAKENERKISSQMATIALMLLSISFPVFIALSNYEPYSNAESDQYFAWILIFFRAQYFNYKWIELAAVAVAILMVVMLAKTKNFLWNLHGAICIVSGLQVLIFMLGSKFMSYQVMSAYGIRGLSLFLLSGFLWIAPLAKHWHLKLGRKTNSFIHTALFVTSTVLVTALLVQSNTPVKISNPLHTLEVLSRSTDATLMYPEQTSKLCPIEEESNQDCVFAVYKGNYVSIKQLGFGNHFYGQWVMRLDQKTQSCLREEFIMQTERSNYELVSLEWLAFCSERKDNQS